MKITNRFRTALLALALFAPASRAGEVYSNLTPTGGFSFTAHSVISGSTAAQSVGQAGAGRTAARVVLNDAVRLESISAVIAENHHGTNHDVRMLLCADANGEPGAVIEDLGVKTAMPHGQFLVPTRFDSTANPALSAGVVYWVMLEATDDDTAVGWYNNTTLALGTAFKHGTNPWGVFLQIVQGTVVMTALPEGYDNTEGTGTFDPISGAWITGVQSFGWDRGQACRFQLGSHTRFERVSLALVAMGPAGNDDVAVSLCADADGLPGAVIEDLGGVTGLPQIGTTSSEMTTVLSVSMPLLAAGEDYWIVVTPVDATTDVRWLYTQGSATSYATWFGEVQQWLIENPTFPQPAMIVEGCGVTVVSYCTAGTSASGCQAQLSSSGAPSASATSGFVVTAAGLEGQKDGLFFYGANGRQANPWGSGTSYQCVTPPVLRAGLLAGSGTVGACDGGFAQDLAQLWTANPAKRPLAGEVVQLQAWYRDPLNSSNQTTSLSDALEFAVLP